MIAHRAIVIITETDFRTNVTSVVAELADRRELRILLELPLNATQRFKVGDEISVSIELVGKSEPAPEKKTAPRVEAAPPEPPNEYAPVWTPGALSNP